MTRPALIREADAARLFKGARAAGYTRVTLSIDPDGRIAVDASDDPAPIPGDRRNPLDRLLEG